MTSNRPPLDFDAIKAAAAGRYVDTIFPAAGIHFARKASDHQSCPMCGGNDRFRCDDKRGEGTWICNQCGAGNGFMLVQRYTNSDVYDTNALIASALGIDGTQQISDEQRQAWRAQQVEREATEKAAKREARIAAAQQAQSIWDNSTPATGDHPYLLRKQVTAIGLHQDASDKLIVPMHYYNIETRKTTLVNVQTIAPDSEKRFLSGGLKKGAYFVIGNSAMFTATNVILICEGYATGATIFDALSYAYPVVVAFDAGNLLAVAPAIRAQYPNHRIIICADNDHATELKTGDNVGISKARQAAMAIGGEVVAPNFTILDTDKDAA